MAGSVCHHWPFPPWYQTNTFPLKSIALVATTSTRCSSSGNPSRTYVGLHPRVPVAIPIFLGLCRDREDAVVVRCDVSGGRAPHDCPHEQHPQCGHLKEIEEDTVGRRQSRPLVVLGHLSYPWNYIFVHDGSVVAIYIQLWRTHRGVCL